MTTEYLYDVSIQWLRDECTRRNIAVPVEAKKGDVVQLLDDVKAPGFAHAPDAKGESSYMS